MDLCTSLCPCANATVDMTSHPSQSPTGDFDSSPTGWRSLRSQRKLRTTVLLLKSELTLPGQPSNRHVEQTLLKFERFARLFKRRAGIFIQVMPNLAGAISDFIDHIRPPRVAWTGPDLVHGIPNLISRRPKRFMRIEKNLTGALVGQAWETVSRTEREEDSHAPNRQISLLRFTPLGIKPSACGSLCHRARKGLRP